MIAVGYARLSDKDSSSNSIKSQCKRIEEYCERNKLELLKIFVDDGKSGWTFDRPGFIDLATKQAFVKQVFGLQLSYADGKYRTPFLHPLFSLKQLTDKDLPFIVEKQTADESAESLLSAPGGNLLEHLMKLAELFAA